MTHLSDEELARIEALHTSCAPQRDPWDRALVCVSCDTPWPCDTIKLVAALREAHAALDVAGVACGGVGHSVRYRIGLLAEDAFEAEQRAEAAEHERDAESDADVWAATNFQAATLRAERDAARAAMIEAERSELRECERRVAAESERDALREAATNLVDQLDAIHENPAYKRVWFTAQNHNGPYAGPNYVEEVKALREALDAAREGGK